MSKTMTLESALARLEEIVAALEGELSIDDAIKLYGEAVKLIDLTGAKLEAARLKVEKLSAAKTTREGQDGPV